MRDVLQALAAAQSAGQAVVFCRLVETRGSTPQKAGAAMLVRPDGSQAGTLGGGCVEAEVKRRALTASGAPGMLTFQLDSDYGWDDGLICGGRMQVLVDPLHGEQSRRYFAELAGAIDAGRGSTEAIILDPARHGFTGHASYLLDAEGRPLAHIGEMPFESLPEAVRNALRPLSQRPRPYVAEGVAWLPTLPRCRLVIVGGGHVGQAVGNYAADLEFDVWAVDDRAEFVSRARFPSAERLIHGPIEETLPQLEITPDTYVLIVTRGHSHDEQALFHLIDRGARYVGMIGSRRKIKMIFSDLEQEGVSRELLAQVYAPVGLSIGSQTVPEIAISILAELIAHRNLNEGRHVASASAVEAL